MNFHVLTLFPQMIMDGLGVSITGRAMENGLISVEALDIREYSTDKHRHVDDVPYGGGAGMVMQAGPVCDAYEALCSRLGKRPRVIYMTPQGRVFNQSIAKELAAEKDLVFLCGHYEGIDERALSLIVTDNLSLGDFVLTGGELPAMVMIDCISRLVPGVLNNEASAEEESFSGGLLEYPQADCGLAQEGVHKENSGAPAGSSARGLSLIKRTGIFGGAPHQGGGKGASGACPACRAEESFG